MKSDGVQACDASFRGANKNRVPPPARLALCQPASHLCSPGCQHSSTAGASAAIKRDFIARVQSRKKAFQVNFI